MMIATVDDFKPWPIERSKVERCLCTKFGLSAWLSNVVWVCIAKINPSQPTTDIRRKFRSQTSDNVGRWKSRGGNSHKDKKEKRRREKIRTEKG